MVFFIGCVSVLEKVLIQQELFVVTLIWIAHSENALLLNFQTFCSPLVEELEHILFDISFLAKQN